MFRIINSVDGNGEQRLDEARAALAHSNKKLSAEISRRAAIRFRENNRTAELDEILCSTEHGTRTHKVFEVNGDTVVIALPDMVMKTVKKDSLYDPSDCEDIFFEIVNSQEPLDAYLRD
jgi:hypothetical protein